MPDVELSEDQFLADIFKDGFEIVIDANDFKKVLRQNVELERKNVELERIVKQQRETIEFQKKGNEFLRDQLKELREPRVIVRLNARA